MTAYSPIKAIFNIGMFEVVGTSSRSGLRIGRKNAYLGLKMDEPRF